MLNVCVVLECFAHIRICRERTRAVAITAGRQQLQFLFMRVSAPIHSCFDCKQPWAQSENGHVSLTKQTAVDTAQFQTRIDRGSTGSNAPASCLVRSPWKQTHGDLHLQGHASIHPMLCVAQPQEMSACCGDRPSVHRENRPRSWCWWTKLLS